MSEKISQILICLNERWCRNIYEIILRFNRVNISLRRILSYAPTPPLSGVNIPNFTFSELTDVTVAKYGRERVQ